MTLLSYQVFQTVVGQGSFQKAAEILNLTPSAVSHAIASMEQELGFSLFTRNKAGVALTNYGEHLLPYVNAVLNSDESLQQAIAGLNGLKMGNVKVQKRKVQFRIRKKNRKKIRDKGHEKKKKRVFTDTEKEVTINTE